MWIIYISCIILSMMNKKPHRYSVLLIYIVLALATFIAFEQVRQNAFVELDDNVYVTDNHHVKSGFTRESVVWAFTTTRASNWHPLTWLSHMLDCQLFGTDPQWHHLVNLFFHIANTLLLFGILKKMTGAVWRSAFIAAVFALHPLHVESVAWISERKDVLSTLFWFLTMAAYLRYTKRPRISRYLLTLLTFALGLLAKPMLVTLPFVLLLLDYWPLDRSGSGKNIRSQWPHLVLEKIPFFVLSAASSIVTYFAQQSGGAVVTFPLKLRIANALLSYISYISKIIYPNRLAVLYPYSTEKLPLWQSVVCFVILVIITVNIIFILRRHRYLTVGWLWYLGTLVPVIGLVQVGAQAIADRYTYLPSIGILIMVGWGAAELFKKWHLPKIVPAIITCLLLAVLLFFTRKQVSYWRNGLTLFGHALEVTENNFIMHNNFGNILLERGYFDEALEHFDEAIRLKPDYPDAISNRSLAYAQLGKYELAVNHFNEVLRINPNHPDAHNNLGGVLLGLGRLDEAVNHLRRALEIEPDRPNFHYNLATAYRLQGKLNEAINSYRQTLRLNPNYADAHNELGRLFLEQGKLNEAVTHFHQALGITPDDANVHYNLANAFRLQGKLNEAINSYRQVLKLKPDFADAHANLGDVLARQGKLEQGIIHFYEALRIRPDWTGAMNNFAWFLATCEDDEFRNPAEAVRFAEHACELSNYENPAFLDTLAVAYAAAGRFPEAVATAEKALELAQLSGQNQLINEIENHLSLYKAGQSYRESLP